MSVSIDQFWKLARTSALLDTKACNELQERFQTVRGADKSANARALAVWLVNERIVTSYQAQVLLAGKPGPFYFGDYRVDDRVESPIGIRRFAGVHVPTNHPVLLHFWLGDSDQWSIIQDQALRHQTLDHPHLDRCYESIGVGSFHIAVTEDVEGKTLRQLTAKPQGISAGDAIRITHQIALALNQIHTASLVHGCVSPDEVIMQPGNHSRLRRLPPRQLGPIGFDVADPKGRLLHQANYLAPELYRMPDRAPNAVSDVYALGCVLYELLSGQPPFPDGTLAEKMKRHATEAIRPIDEFRATPSGLGEVVSFMMAKQPDLRYQQSVEVAQKLEAFLGGSPKAQPARPRSTEAFYLSHLQKQRDRVPTHLTNDEAKPTGEEQKSNREVEESPEAKNVFPNSPIITTPSDESRGTRTRRTKSRETARGFWNSGVVAAGAILLLVSGIAIWVNIDRDRSERVPDKPRDVATNSTQDGSGSAETSATRTTSVEPDDGLVDDDGSTLWMSPTSGPPIDLDFAPPSSQFFLFALPRKILASNEGPAVFKALGPLNNQIRKRFESMQIPFHEVDQLLVALTPQDVGPPRVTTVARFDSEAALKKILDSIAYEDSDDGPRWRTDKAEAVVPKADPRCICVGRDEDLREILAAAGAPPLLDRQLERLRRLSDNERHLTLLFDPQFIAADGRETLTGMYAMLREPIQTFLGDQVQAASVSLHFENPFFGEIRLASSLDQDPIRLAAACREKWEQLPAKLNGYLSRLAIQRYWQPIALRFPLMIKYLEEQTRIGVADQSAVIRFVMPEKSAHNLFLASQLAVEAHDPGANETSTPQPSAADWATILGHRTDLSFPQLSLEFAMRDFASAVNDEFPGTGFQIKIIGSDLQLAGITRNQQIRDVNLEQQTVDEILTELVRRANPVLAPAVSSPEQKLVWVREPPADSTGKTILITTRTAATQKGYSLPGHFLANSP